MILVSLEDVTQHRQIEAANRWMVAIVESSDDAIISTDLNGIIMSCNQGAARLFGYSGEELTGQPMTMLIPADHQNEEAEILAQIRSGKRVEHFETVRQRKDGSLIEVSLVISPVKNAAGAVIGASKIARDITQRRQAEQEVAQSFEREKIARERAEAANKAKDDFLASLSHELRTRLNPVLLIASDASENPALPREVRANFETIRKNIELEARLIDDLLDLTRIAHGKLALHSRPVDVRLVLEEAMGTLRSDLTSKFIRLRFTCDIPTAYVFGDDVRLQQIFWNILKNAVKFTPNYGNISIVVTEAAGTLKVAVSDTGIGIPAGETELIFGAFSQGDRTKSDIHRFGGLGLGLAISRKLVEMHKGRITAASDGPGCGSTFTVELPSIPAEKAHAQLSLGVTAGPAEETSKHSIHILLVEDHEPTRVTLAHLLSRRGYLVLAVGTAFEARKIASHEPI